MTLNISRQKLQKLQVKDHRIQSFRERNPKLLVEQNGLLYYFWATKHSKETIEQLILPKQCHQIVYCLVNTIALAGYLG